jgi:DnaD/phage-associated family protein
MLNTPANQRLADRIRLGEVKIAELGKATPAATPAEPRPTIYQLYEDNVGLLTPLLAQELREAELTYPANWIEDAFREAVGYNKRSWRYVRRILENWGANGRGAEPVGEPRRDTQSPRDPRAYLSGRYGKYIKH